MPETFLNFINTSLDQNKPIKIASKPDIHLQCFKDTFNYYIQIEKELVFIEFMNNENKLRLALNCAKWFTSYLKEIA